MSLTKTSSISLGMAVLLASVALNGVLAGVIIAKKTHPTPYQGQSIQGPRGAAFSAPADPHRVLRNLSPERRKAVLKKAMNAVPRKDRQQFRKLRGSLGKAEQAVFEAASAGEYNAETLSAALGDLRTSRARLGQASDTLLVNIWGELTLEERKVALEAMRSRSSKQQKRRKQRRDREEK